MSLFAPDFKELVRSRTNLVELVGESIALKAKGGHDHIGLCPFHPDHNPSFHVYSDRQTYRCWVCQEGGDCFSFVMKYEAVGFREALELLANRAGVEMLKPERQSFGGPTGRPPSSRTSDVDPNENSEISKPLLYEVVAWADQQFHQALLSSQGAEPLAYLKGRGISDETIAKWRLGYHPNDWQWLIHRARGKYTLPQLIAARLVVSKDDGRSPFDCFVDRVIFPIRDERGRPVAFGARILPGRDATKAGKYINSQEGPIFQKSRLLFGLDFARDAIRLSANATQPATVAVVEGNADCVMCHQHGVTNVVAPMGTALAESHVQILKRWAKRVVLVFDGDAAGRMAAERALPKFLAHDVDLRVLTLPDGSKDPDEFLQQHGAKAFRALMKDAPDVLNYKLDRSVERFGLDSAGARDQVLGEMLDLMAESRELAGSPREHAMLSRLAQRLLVPNATLLEQLQRRRRKATARPVQSSAASPAAPSGRPQENRAGSRRGDVSRGDGIGRPAPVAMESNDALSRHDYPSLGDPSSEDTSAGYGTDTLDSTSTRPTRAARQINEVIRGVQSREVLQERELLEILLTAPEWAEAIRSQVSVEDFRHDDLRDLAQVCYDVVEQGLPPSCDRVIAVLEDPELKRLAVALDGMAREKGVADLLRHDRPHLEIGGPSSGGQSSGGRLEFSDGEQVFSEGATGAGNRPPPFLQQVLDRMTWRRQEQSHLPSRLRMAQQTSGLDPNARALLERVTEFNARRAAKKPPPSGPGRPGLAPPGSARMAGSD